MTGPVMTARSDDVSPHEDRQKDENPCKVLEGLYIGAGKCAWNLDQLERFNITHVVNAAPQVESCLHASRVKYLTVNVHDDPEERIQDFFEQTNNFIEEALNNEGGVLVHCHSGVSRCAALVLGYLIGRQCMEFDRAYRLLKKERNIAPNDGFLTQLRQYAMDVQWQNEDEDDSASKLLSRRFRVSNGSAEFLDCL